MSQHHAVSHGRGGAANIRPDDTVYADGEIVREGPVGDQGDGKYSSGRGGGGNIVGNAVQGKVTPHDSEIVPETATRVAKLESHHVGRGGAGNESHVHKDKSDQHGFSKTGEGIGDKIKHFLHMDKKE